MKKLCASFALAVLCFSLPAFAARYDTLTMTCKEARAVLQQAGSLKMYTGPNIFNRYQANPGLLVALVPTRDTDSCQLGYVNTSHSESDHTYVVRRPVNPELKACRGEGNWWLVNPQDLEANPQAIPIFRVCRNGFWRTEKGNATFTAGSGISIIGASYRSK